MIQTLSDRLTAIKDFHRGLGHAYMARIVPNNSFAFPPSMEVSVGGSATQEQLPRTPVSRTMQEQLSRRGGAEKRKVWT